MARLTCAVVLLLRGVAAQTPSPPALPPSSPPTGFVPGAICDAVDLTDFSYNLLRGRHMVILETTYVPFAFKDVESPTGWSLGQIHTSRNSNRKMGVPATLSFYKVEWKDRGS